MPEPTKGSGVFRFSPEVYLEFKYDIDNEVLRATFHYGETVVELVPEVS